MDLANSKIHTTLPNMMSYILTRRFNSFVKHTGRSKEKVRNSGLAPVIDPKTGEPVRLWWWALGDPSKVPNKEWYEQYCYLPVEEAESVSRANAKMYQETGKRMMFKWCFRPPEQQAIMWVRTCHSDTAKKKCKETNPNATQVGKPGGSWHQLDGFDIANPKQSVEYLNEEGFIGYCDSDIKSLRDSDKGHFYPGSPAQLNGFKTSGKNLKKIAVRKACEAKAWTNNLFN